MTCPAVGGVIHNRGAVRSTADRNSLGTGPKSCLFFHFRPSWHELDLLEAQLDLEPIAGLPTQLGGVGLADKQVAVELHLGGIAELPARTTLAATTTPGSEIHALGLKQRLVEGGEVQPLRAILLGGDVAAAAHQTGLGDIAQLLDELDEAALSGWGEQITTGEHDLGLG